MTTQLHQNLLALQAAIPTTQFTFSKTAALDVDGALRVLKDPRQNTAAGLYLAARTRYGEEILQWEPETLWITMDKDGVDLPEEERNKLQAAITLILNPSFYWDNLVFQRTVRALNGELFDPETIQECVAAHIAWAVYEAGVIRGLDNDETVIPDYDEDVQQFIAVCLFREGYVYAPEPLTDFVQDNLEGLFPKNSTAFTLKKEVADSWDKLDKESLERTEFFENELGVQLAQLSACYLYIKERTDQLTEDLATSRGLLG
jgi:hypothetical protein